MSPWSPSRGLTTASGLFVRPYRDGRCGARSGNQRGGTLRSRVRVRHDARVAMIDSRRIRDPLLVLLILAGLVFGLAPLLVPRQFGDFAGFRAQDLFLYRLAGAATLGYGVALLVGFRAPWRELRILIASTAVFNGASIAACLVAIVQGGAQWLVYVILLASILFTAGTLNLLANPPLGPGERAGPDGSPDVSQWIVALFAIGVTASLVFGLGPLVAGGGLWSSPGVPRLRRLHLPSGRCRDDRGMRRRPLGAAIPALARDPAGGRCRAHVQCRKCGRSARRARGGQPSTGRFRDPRRSRPGDGRDDPRSAARRALRRSQHLAVDRVAINAPTTPANRGMR